MNLKISKSIYLTIIITLIISFYCLGAPNNQAAAQTGVVSGSVVNIRSGPGANYGIDGTLYKGTGVELLATSGEWYKVQYGTVSGWVHQSLLSNTITATSLSGTSPATSADQSPLVILNGEQMSFEVPPIIENGRTLVPLRAVFEAMGATVSWNDSTRTVTATQGGTTVILPIGSTSPTVNGVVWGIEVPAKIISDRTLAPLRFVGEAFGGNVGWDPNTRTVSITTSSEDKVTEVTISSGEVNLRSGPSTSYSKVDLVRSGERLAVLGEKDGWYQVSRGGTTAWVAGWVVTADTGDISNTENGTGDLDPQTPLDETEDAVIENDNINNYGDENTAVETGFLSISTRQISEGYRLLIRTAEEANPLITESDGGKKIVYTYKDVKVKQGRAEAYFYLDSTRNGRVDIEAQTMDDTTWVTIKLPNKYVYKTASEEDGKKHSFLIPSQLKDIEEIFLPNGNQVIMISSLANMAYQEEKVNNHLILQLPGTYQGLALERYQLEGNIASKITVGEINAEPTTQLDIEIGSIEAYYVNKNVNGKTISIILVPPKDKNQPPSIKTDITVVIDPGHGGSDPGASSYSRNLSEKEVNIKMAQQVKVLLEKAGLNVIMTRTDDSYIGLNERCQIANSAGADLFISIHCDAVANPTANGTGTFSYAPEDNQLLAAQQYQRSLLADLLQKQLVDKLGRANRGVRQANFAVLRETNMPAALVETAFISNPEEEKLLADSSFQQKAARAIAEAVQKYVSLML